MKKLLFKIVTLVLCIILLNALFYRFIIQPNVSFSWGDKDIHAKRMYLKQNNEKFNTLFIGSSAMFRHVNPSVFDSICHDSLAIRSFNFGIPAMFPEQSEYIYKHILSEDKPNLKYVFMELIEVGNFLLIINVQRKRTHYWYSLKSYMEALQVSFHYESPYYIKATAFISYTFGYLSKLLNAEIVEEILLKQKESSFSNFPYLQDNRNGYYSLDQEYLDTKEESNNMQKRINMFEKDTLQNTKLMLRSKEFMSDTNKEKYKINQLHLDKINQLIALSKANNIHLIFILPPRLSKHEYPMLLPLFSQIDDQHKINLNNSQLYPQFYETKYTFDPLHLNEAGANQFSIALANEFNRIISKDNL